MRVLGWRMKSAGEELSESQYAKVAIMDTDFARLRCSDLVVGEASEAPTNRVFGREDSGVADEVMDEDLPEGQETETGEDDGGGAGHGCNGAGEGLAEIEEEIEEDIVEEVDCRELEEEIERCEAVREEVTLQIALAEDGLEETALALANARRLLRSSPTKPHSMPLHQPEQERDLTQGRVGDAGGCSGQEMLREGAAAAAGRQSVVSREVLDKENVAAERSESCAQGGGDRPTRAGIKLIPVGSTQGSSVCSSVAKRGDGVEGRQKEGVVSDREGADSLVLVCFDGGDLSIGELRVKHDISWCLLQTAVERRFGRCPNSDLISPVT